MTARRCDRLAPNHRWGQRTGNSELVDAVTGGLTDPFDDHPMGVTAENVAAKWGVSRRDRDALAVQSHQRAARATKRAQPNGQHVPRLMLLLAAVRCYVLFRSFGCMVEGMHLMAMRQMRLMRGRHHFPRLVKSGGFAVVPGCVFMMFSRKFMEFAQR